MQGDVTRLYHFGHFKSMELGTGQNGRMRFVEWKNVLWHQPSDSWPHFSFGGGTQWGVPCLLVVANLVLVLVLVFWWLWFA